MRGVGVDDIERECAHALAVALDQIGELRRIARGGEQTIAACEHGLRDIATQAAVAASDQPDFRHEMTP
ncbi:hypothetical protein D3C71_2173800 [compost metagenome]